MLREHENHIIGYPRNPLLYIHLTNVLKRDNQALVSDDGDSGKTLTMVN